MSKTQKVLEEIKYKKGIVTFMDILGWRSLLATKSATELADVLDVLRKEGDPVPRLDIDPKEDEKWAAMYSYAALSDCVFRCTDIEHDINKKWPDGPLYHELTGLVFVQSSLIRKGFLLRGAVTFGEYFGSRDSYGVSIFGPAIARAYEMETNLANYPRIVIDPSLIDEFFKNKYLKKYDNSPVEEWAGHIHDFLKRDESGVWFLDYLGVYPAVVGDTPSTRRFLLQHKELIESNLKQLLTKKRPYPDSITGKFLWLVRYHNGTLDGYNRASWKELLNGKKKKFKKKDFYVSIPSDPVFFPYERIAGEFNNT